MSQNVYYSEWTGERGDYRIEFYAASAITLHSPNYVEIPEDVLLIEKFNIEFDKIPLGLAKAPVLEFKVRLRNAIELSPEFKSLFLDSVRDLTWDDIFADAKKVLAGTVVKLSLPDDPDYFIGIIKEDTDVDIDFLTGEIQVSAVHWLKVALDSVDFGDFRFFCETYNYVDHSDAIGEIHYEEPASSNNEYNMLIRNYRFGFVKQYRIFEYISLQLALIRQSLLRETHVHNVYVPHCEIRHYKQHARYPMQLGNELQALDVEVLFSVAKPGKQPFGGLAYDGSSGIARYRSAWDFLADYYESCMARAYIFGGYDVKVRKLTGRYGRAQQTIEVDADEIEEGKLKLNSMMLSTVTSSRQETVASDISKYESVRASSRNSHEYTVPIIFNNVPPAGDWGRYGTNYNWGIAAPYIWGLYYQNNALRMKVHHYCEYAISHNKWSSMYSNCVYNPASSELQSAEELLTSDPNSAVLIIQSESGNAKWAANTLRNAYDRKNQSTLEDVVMTPAGAIGEPFVNYYKFDTSEITDGLEIGESMYMPIGYEYDFEKEKLKLSFIRIDENAI